MAPDGKALDVEHDELAGVVEAEDVAGQRRDQRIAYLIASLLPSSSRGRIVRPSSSKRCSMALRVPQLFPCLTRLFSGRLKKAANGRRCEANDQTLLVRFKPCYGDA